MGNFHAVMVVAAALFLSSIVHAQETDCIDDERDCPKKDIRGPGSMTIVPRAEGGSSTGKSTETTGLLGFDGNLEAEFADTLEYARNFEQNFGAATGYEGYSAEYIDKNIDNIGKPLWKEIINSENSYFDSIASIANASTDPEAQNTIAHATISAHLAYDFGDYTAEALGNVKEEFFKGSDLDTAKDLLNNMAGRDIGLDILRNGGSVEDIPQAISDAYNDGLLWIIRDGEVVSSDTPPTK